MATPLFSLLQETTRSIRNKHKNNNSFDYASGTKNIKVWQD
jgi:hypothetical protein